MSQSVASTLDPYDEKPSPWQAHAGKWAALAVFVLTVVLTVMSFPPMPAPEFAYAFAVPAILWAYRGPRLKLFLGTVLAAQAVAWTLLLGWLHHVTWLGLLLLGPFVGVWVGLWYLAVWWVVPRMRGRRTGFRIMAMLGLAGIWVLIEWTRTWVLSGFPWLPLAASQWQRTIILQIASYTGAGGVSFILICFNLGFAAYAHRLLFEKRRGLRRRSPEFMVALLVLIFPSFLLLRELFGQDRVTLARVAFVQPYIPQSVKWDATLAREHFDIVGKTTLLAATGRPDFILLPEAVLPSEITDDRVRDWMQQIGSQAAAPIVFGSVSVEKGNAPGAEELWRNGAFVVDPMVGLQTTTYSKRHLVPFGEFVPFRPVLGWLKKFTDVGDGDFQPGDRATPLVVAVRGGSVALGPLICFEDVFPQLARESVLWGGEVLAVLTNNGWFGEGGAADQHAAHSVLRAVETRRPVIRCGNGGWSGVIDEYGGIRSVMKQKDAGIYFRGAATFDLTRDRRWEGRNSFYVQNGDWFVGFAALLALLGFGAVKLKPTAATMEEEEPV